MSTSSDHPVDEKLPAGRLAALGLQHVLVMYAGAVAVPLIIGRALKLSPTEVAMLISADLFCCGLVTLIQSLGLGGWFGIRLPVMMGVTFAAVGPMVAMANVSTGPDGARAIFGAIIVLCWLTFRSWKAVLCILVPLTIVAIMCNALMAWLGIGLKVPTLPVIALGVGVGVDYGIYLYERMQHEFDDKGSSLREAFYEAMRQRGTAVETQDFEAWLASARSRRVVSPARARSRRSSSARASG